VGAGAGRVCVGERPGCVRHADPGGGEGLRRGGMGGWLSAAGSRQWWQDGGGEMAETESGGADPSLGQWVAGPLWWAGGRVAGDAL